MSIDCLLHVHSSFSYDSRTDLADIVAIARRNGIRCVLMSEHNNFLDDEQVAAFVARCDELSDEHVLVIPGLELSFDENRIHLLAYGVRRYIGSTAPGCTLSSLIAAVREAGGVAVLAHPSHRQASDRVALDDLRRLDGIEVWNVKNDNRVVPTMRDLRLLRRTRAAGGRCHGFAGLDWHHVNKFARLVLDVDAPAVTPDAILGALRDGRFRIRGTHVTVEAAGERRWSRLAAYAAVARTLSGARGAAYRCQSALERAGVKVPQFLLGAARRVL